MLSAYSCIIEDMVKTEKGNYHRSSRLEILESYQMNDPDF